MNDMNKTLWEALSGLAPGSLTLLAGGVGMGKTWKLVQLAHEHFSSGNPVRVLSEDIVPVQFLRRYIAAHGTPDREGLVIHDEGTTLATAFHLSTPGTMLLIDSARFYQKVADWGVLRQEVLAKRVHLVISVQAPRTVTPMDWHPTSEAERSCDLIVCLGPDKTLYVSKSRDGFVGWLDSTDP